MEECLQQACGLGNVHVTLEVSAVWFCDIPCTKEAFRWSIVSVRRSPFAPEITLNITHFLQHRVCIPKKDLQHIRGHFILITSHTSSAKKFLVLGPYFICEEHMVSSLLCLQFGKFSLVNYML